MSTKYKEESTIRQWLKKQSLLKGKVKRKGGADPRIAPYMYFFHCLSEYSSCAGILIPFGRNTHLSDQETTIEKIIEIIAAAETSKQKAASQLTAKLKISSDMNEIWDEMRLESEAISHEEVQDIFAGTLFVLLNNLLWSMASRVHSRGGGEIPKFGGRAVGHTSLFELIRTAGNNFRHHEEWHGVISKNKQFANNVAVLKAAGLKHPWNRNMCGEIFERIGWHDRKELSLEIRKLASEIFQHQTGLPL